MYGERDSLLSRYYSWDPWIRYEAEIEMRLFERDLYYLLRERDPLYKILS